MGNAVFAIIIKPILYDAVERTGPPAVAISYFFTAMIAFFMMSSLFSTEDPGDMEPGSTTHTIFTINPFHYDFEEENEIQRCRESEEDQGEGLLLLDILFGPPGSASADEDDEEGCYELYDDVYNGIAKIEEDFDINTEERNHEVTTP